jgi:hypothetical protein
MGERERRLTIMRMVQAGEISAEEGSRWIAALKSEKRLSDPVKNEFSDEALPPETAQVEVSAEAFDADPEVMNELSEDDLRLRIDGWKRWWTLPFTIGIILTILAAIWMYQGWEAAGLSWGFWLSWIPFSIGIAIAALAWASQTMPWLHLRIRDKDSSPGLIAFSLPLPVKLASWGLKRFEQFSPDEFRDKHFGEMAEALSAVFETEDPIQIMVNGDAEERVEVFIVGAKK